MLIIPLREVAPQVCVTIYFSNLLISFTDTSPVGAVVGIIGGIILLFILFIAILLCICCCISAGKRSSYNQSIGLASTAAVHPPQTADARLVADTKFTQQVPPPSFEYIPDNISAYPEAHYIQQPLLPPGPLLGPPPAYPATEYELVDNPAPYLPQQPSLMLQPTAQMEYPPVGYPVQSYGYPQMEDTSNL